MKKIAIILVIVGLYGCKPETNSDSNDWQMLFNGTDLTGFKASEKTDCFTVENSTIKVQNGRSHLFYVGPIENADFENFHFSAKVKTTPGSNSGIYFHTAYQQTGWPKKGYECQVNLSGSDSKKSGSLYDALNVSKQYAKDNQWYTQEIIVNGKHVITKINGQIVADYTEPENVNFPGWPERKLSSGTFAIQGHDPKSVVYYKEIKVRTIK